MSLAVRLNFGLDIWTCSFLGFRSDRDKCVFLAASPVGLILISAKPKTTRILSKLLRSVRLQMYSSMDSPHQQAVK